MESSIKYQPKYGRVLIERKINKKIGSLILPDGVDKRHAPCEGTIVALGETAGWTDVYDAEGNKSPKQTLAIGDEVIFGRHSGAWLNSTSLEKDDGTLFICQDEDILVTIKR